MESVLIPIGVAWLALLNRVSSNPKLARLFILLLDDIEYNVNLLGAQSDDKSIQSITLDSQLWRTQV